MEYCFNGFKSPHIYEAPWILNAQLFIWRPIISIRKWKFPFWMAIKMVKKAISTVVRYISTINMPYNLYSLNHLHAKINLNIYKIQFVWLKVAIKYPTCNRFELILRSHEQNIHMHIVHRLFTETIENYTKSVFKILIFFCYICRIHN